MKRFTNLIRTPRPVRPRFHGRATWFTFCRARSFSGERSLRCVGLVATFAFALFFFSNAHAAYRVYQYVVRSAEKAAVPLAYLDTSTLPPMAYQTYHGSNLIEVELLRSWPCPGDTSQRPFCPAPGDQILTLPAAAAPSPGSSL